MVMMRPKKGSKVEVLSKRKVPLGSWRPGEIVYGNGHTYADDQIVERVSRKFIKPCPPSMDSVRNWVAGDIAEVFDNHTWKNAVILKVVDRDYIVRLDGYPGELRVHKSDLRGRISLKNNQSEAIGKDSGMCDNRGAKEHLSAQSCSIPSYKAMEVRTGGKQLQGFDNQNGLAKRSAGFCSSDAETLERVGQKFRRIEKDGRCQHLTAALPAPFLKRDSGICDDGGAKELLSVQSCSKPSCKATKVQTGGKQFRGLDNQNGQARGSQFCSSDTETLARGVGQKFRRIDKDGRCQ